MKWQPVDCIVAALVAIIIYAIVIMGVIHIMGIETEQAELLKIRAGLFASIISIISMYVGARLNNKGNDDEDR